MFLDILNNMFYLFTYTKKNPENVLRIIQILISLFVIFYSGYKFIFHSIMSLKKVLQEVFFVVFWGLILFTSLLYLYTNSNHEFVKNIIVPFIEVMIYQIHNFF